MTRKVGRSHGKTSQHGVERLWDVVWDKDCGQQSRDQTMYLSPPTRSAERYCSISTDRYAAAYAKLTASDTVRFPTTMSQPTIQETMGLRPGGDSI